MGRNEISRVDEVLLQHKIFPNKKGYGYLKGVILTLSRDKNATLKSAYAEIAKVKDVKISAVEKGISNVIEKSFESFTIAEKYGKAVNKEKGKLTNKQFIFTVLKVINHT